MRDLMRPYHGSPGDVHAMRHARNFAQGIHPSGVDFLRPWPLGCFSEMSAALAQAPVEPTPLDTLLVPENPTGHSGTAGGLVPFDFDNPDDECFPGVGEAESD